MKVLVGYASAHGSTAGIARAIADRLTRAGLRVRVCPIDEVESVVTFDAVILGSAIHDRAWLPEASGFVKRNAVDLASRPVWLFSVSSVGETSSFLASSVARLIRRLGNEAREVAAFRETIRPRGHRSFAGAVERAHWGVAGDLFLRLLGGSYGDHRDWQDIEAWADAIGRDLEAWKLAPWTVTPPPVVRTRASRPAEANVRLPTRSASRTPPRRVTRTTARSRGARIGARAGVPSR